MKALSIALPKVRFSDYVNIMLFTKPFEIFCTDDVKRDTSYGLRNGRAFGQSIPMDQFLIKNDMETYYTKYIIVLRNIHPSIMHTTIPTKYMHSNLYSKRLYIVFIKLRKYMCCLWNNVLFINVLNEFFF